ncbi:MAG: gephyrin-like molybdotransferase Glp [Pseudomonadota bacterium]
MGGLLPVDDARARMFAAAPAVTTEKVSVDACAGRILAAPVIAETTQPSYPASAMDGYAVRFADVAKTPAHLNVIGEAPAGAAFDGDLGPGEAVRIFTGGVVPGGADHVVIQEDVEGVGEQDITVTAPQDRPANVRAAGLDFRNGDALLPIGVKLDGPRPALVAAANLAQVEVYRKPKVALLATGDELVAPGANPGRGQVVSSTPYGLLSLISEWGGEPRYDGLARDDVADIRAKIDLAADADIVVPIGGASVGDYDLVKKALDAAGLEIDFAKIAVKPGKPTWFGRLDRRLVLGLPGNPASALVCAYLFLKPLMFAMTGRRPADATPEWSARLTEDVPKNGAREAYLRARLARGGDGALTVSRAGLQDSSLLTPFATADCLIIQPPQHAAGAGETVTVIPLTE